MWIFLCQFSYQCLLPLRVLLNTVQNVGCSDSAGKEQCCLWFLPFFKHRSFSTELRAMLLLQQFFSQEGTSPCWAQLGREPAGSWVEGRHLPVLMLHPSCAKNFHFCLLAKLRDVRGKGQDVALTFAWTTALEDDSKSGAAWSSVELAVLLGTLLPGVWWFFEFTLPFRLFIITATCWDRQLLTNTKGFQTALQTVFECLRQSLKCIQHENNPFCSLTASHPSSSQQGEVVLCWNVLDSIWGAFFYYYYSCSLGNPISLSSGEWPNTQSVLLFFSICSCITFLACPRKEAKLMSSCTICVSLALVKHRMWWRDWALKIQGSTLSGSLFRRGRLWMMALVWDAAYFSSCVQHSAQGSLFQVGPLRFREVSYLVLVPPQPGSPGAQALMVLCSPGVHCSSWSRSVELRLRGAGQVCLC